jgi:methylglyoxal synthase
VSENTETVGFRAFLKKYGLVLFFPVSIFYLELVFSLFVYTSSWGNISILKTILYVFFSSAMFGGVFYILSSIIKNPKWRKDRKMKIAIIAHDAKKELMVQFCSAYCGILSKHSLIATNTTGKQVSEATGLPIKRYLSGRGGAEQILALLSCNEVDVLLFFRDPINPKANDPNDMDLLRLCDVHSVPVATNIATAEALILALERGDLDWRQAGSLQI